jgi:hypothetical protein
MRARALENQPQMGASRQPVKLCVNDRQKSYDWQLLVHGRADSGVLVLILSPWNSGLFDDEADNRGR